MSCRDWAFRHVRWLDFALVWLWPAHSDVLGPDRGAAALLAVWGVMVVAMIGSSVAWWWPHWAGA